MRRCAASAIVAGLVDAERTGARGPCVATDARGFVTGAGGPIVDTEPLMFRHELFPSAATLVSALRFSVPASESTDGGEPILRVVKTAESRRHGIFDSCAGFKPAVPRTHMRRLSCFVINKHVYARKKIRTSSSSCCFESSAILNPLRSCVCAAW
jgi:hypothetical protein